MIPFIDLTRDNNENDMILERIKDVVSSGRFILGNEVETFERSFEKFTKIAHCIGVNSGTDALTLILMALDSRKTGVCSAAPLPCGQAIINAGSVPFFLDSESASSGSISISDLEANIGEMDSLIAVHLYGVPEKIELISGICREHHVNLIEDCSQSVDTYINGMHTGHFSRAAAFSFYPTKNLGAFGDSGLIATNESELAGLFSMMRNYGQDKIYSGMHKGMNSRMDEMQAAVLSVKLSMLGEKNKRRRKIGFRYRDEINNKFIEMPVEEYFSTGNMHIFPVFSEKREALKKHLDLNGIGNMIHYPVPLGEQDAFKKFRRQCINAASLSKREISIPIFPELENKEVSEIIQYINAF